MSKEAQQPGSWVPYNPPTVEELRKENAELRKRMATAARAVDEIVKPPQVSVAYPAEAQMVLADPNASKEELGAAYHSAIIKPESVPQQECPDCGRTYDKCFEYAGVSPQSPGAAYEEVEKVLLRLSKDLNAGEFESIITHAIMPAVLGAIRRTAPRETGWVRVEEQLPNSNDEYLIVDEDGVSTADFFTDNQSWATVRSYGIDSETETLHTVTHWMPLPAPPASEKGKEVRNISLESEDVVVYLARELYDRFVMGGWEPRDSFDLINDALRASGHACANCGRTPREHYCYFHGDKQTFNPGRQKAAAPEQKGAV